MCRLGMPCGLTHIRRAQARLCYVALARTRLVACTKERAPDARARWLTWMLTRIAGHQHTPTPIRIGRYIHNAPRDQCMRVFGCTQHAIIYTHELITWMATRVFTLLSCCMLNTCLQWRDCRTPYIWLTRAHIARRDYASMVNNC